MAESARIEDLRKRYHENPRRFFAPLANEYRKSGFIDRALLLCEKHLAEQPENMNGLVVYGQALFESGRHEDARGPFERALGLDHENLIALRHLGDIARLTGDVPTAKAWYDKLLEFDRRNDEVLELLEGMGVGDAPLVAPPRPSTNSLISVAPSVSVSGGDAADLGLVQIDMAPAPVAAGPGKTKVINAQSLADVDRRQSEAAGAATVGMEAVGVPRAEPRPAPRPAPNRRASLLDVSFDFSEIAESPSAKPVMPAAPVLSAEAAEYGFAEVAPEPIADRAPAPTAGFGGLELAEFSSDASPLAGLEATEFTSDTVSPLAELEVAEEFSVDASPLADLDRPNVTADDIAPLSGLEGIGMADDPMGQMTAGLPMLGDTPDEPMMAIPPVETPMAPPMRVSQVPSLADTLRIDPPRKPVPSPAPLPEPFSDLPEPLSSPSAPRPRMTRADMASLPLIADFGLEEDTPADTAAVPAAPESRPSQRTPTFVTETMATLYVQQGFRDKALEVYRLLVQQSPNDAGLHAKLAALEMAEQEMPEFEASSDGSLEPEPAPANAALADVSFMDVGLSTPRPSSSRTPLSTPIAAGPTAREFFSAFARRGLAAAATVAAVSVAAAEPVQSAELPMTAEVATVDEVVVETAVVTESGWPLDALFGAATEVRDLHAAAVLAGVATFEGPSGGTGLEQLFAVQAPTSTPSDGVRRTVSRASQSLKFDQFFSPSQSPAGGAQPAAAGTPSPEPAASTPSSQPAQEPNDDDLDQFKGWLKGLKP